MATRAVERLLAMHNEAHPHIDPERATAEVRDYLRRAHGLTPDLRPLSYTLSEIPAAYVVAYAAEADAATADLTALRRPAPGQR